MAKREKDTSVWDFSVAKEYKKALSDRGDGGLILCVGNWVKDGKPLQTKLEFREFWNQEGGGIKVGKGKGWGAPELELILKNILEIGAKLGLPKQILVDCLKEGMGEPAMTWNECQAIAEGGTPLPPGEPF